MKDYKAPELVIEEFELEDVLTVSRNENWSDEGWY